MNKPNKPNKPQPLTNEQKAEQIARFFSQKREQYFSLILAAAIRSGRNTNLKECIDASLEGADYAIEKLYPLPKHDRKEDER